MFNCCANRIELVLLLATLLSALTRISEVKKMLGLATNNNNIITNIALCTVTGSTDNVSHPQYHLHNVQQARPERTQTTRLVRQGTSLVNRIGVQP